MVKIQIAVDSSKMQNLDNKILEIRKKGLTYASQGVIRHLKQYSPVDKGLL